MMRFSSAEYRSWSINDWCKHVNSLDVQTLSQWAEKARSSYNHAVTLGHQRKIAKRLGWLPKLEKDEMYRMSDIDFVQRFKHKQVRTLTDMWKSAQHWCEFLRREGRLETVANKLGCGYVVEWHPTDDVDYYVQRCNRVGDFSAWNQLDRNAADAARRFGLMEEVKKLAPRRPETGYSTKGGNCHSLPELVVSRLLEANKIQFVTQFDYPFTFARGKRHKSKCDFYLVTEGAFVEVWSTTQIDPSVHFEQYLVRRRFKTDMCEKLNIRLLHIEGSVLFRQRIEIYLMHIQAVLNEVGIKTPRQITPARALSV